MEFETLDEKDWSAIKDSSSKELTHDIHPYFAKFSPEIPRYLIREYTDEGDVVLDPFSGSGTTLVESLSLGRNAIGVDANPLACLIAKVKTTKLQDGDRRLAREVISDISTDVNSLYGQQNLLGKSFEEPEIPEFHNRDDWFNKNVQKELAVIKRRIEDVQNERVYDVLRIAFSRIIVGVSNQDSESRYTQVENDVKNKECLERFTEQANYILDKLQSLEAEVPELVRADIYNEDSREMEGVPSNCADFVVTSPPYLNSWDYGLYHKFRFKWLDLDVDTFNQREIGRHLRRKGDKVSRYRNDMSAVLENVARVLRDDGCAVIVNATSVVDGAHIDTNDILVEEAQKHGLTLGNSVSKEVYGPHFGMRANSDKMEENQKVEKMLVFHEAD